MKAPAALIPRPFWALPTPAENALQLQISLARCAGDREHLRNADQNR